MSGSCKGCNEADSNSPAAWEIQDGTWTLTLFNSVAGWAELSRGTGLKTLAEQASVDVFLGPSIHWNASLKTYVMLLNRATSNTWAQGGVYVSFNDRVDAPTEWSAPALVTRGGSWYPQVIGLDPAGTDSYSGSVARFFMAGKSEHLIVFGRR